MSNGISSMYTKDRNIRTGRKGYGQWKHEMENTKIFMECSLIEKQLRKLRLK